MSNREADQIMRWTCEDNPSANDEREVEIQIERSDSPSSSSRVRSEDSRNPPIRNNSSSAIIGRRLEGELRTIACPSCAHHIPINHQGGILHDLPGMPAGVRFDPTDAEILEHLEAKVNSDSRRLHPLIDEFIQTLEGENGICYTHPENLPGVSKDGLIRHYFHRPSKAYTTGSRKRRKVSSSSDDIDGSAGGETRWHKTGKTRPVAVNGVVKGFKKILVLYSNFGRQKKPEKTSWVMHQYHLGNSEDEKDGELVLSKVFYQTQPRHSLHPPQPSITINQPLIQYQQQPPLILQQHSDVDLEYCRRHHQQQQQQGRFISFGHHDQSVVRGSLGSNISHQLITNFGMQGDHGGSSFISLDGKKEQVEGDMQRASTS
ncbi:hypothetical protein V2J09_019277 [Rumex salicifolius]